MYCLCGFYPLLNDKRISQPPFYFSQRPSTSVHISSASYHIQHQIAEASQLKMRANRFQLLQLKPGEVYLLFDRFEPDFNPPATLIHQNRRRRLHLDVIAHQDDAFILFLSLYNSPDNQHYRADYRVFSHNTVVAILPPQTTALLHLGAGDGVTNHRCLLRLVVQRKGHVRRDFGYQSQSGIVDRSHQRM